METNLIQLDELFHLENQALRSYSPLTLAYIGDGIYRSEERRVGKECRSRWSPYH